MLTKVEVVSARGEVLELPFSDLSSGYLVKDIEGLDPVRAAIISSPVGQKDGTQYQSSRRENRNIVIKLGLEDGYGSLSVRQLRNRLYNYLMPKTTVTLRFFVDGVQLADISGRVESLESPLFTKDPEATISILCFDPDFIESRLRIFNGETVTDYTNTIIPYNGTTETGFVFFMRPGRAISEVTIYNRQVGGGKFQQLEFIAPLLASDALEISTIPGQKRVMKVPDWGSPTSVLYGVNPTSNWIQLFPGDNEFRVVLEGVPVLYTLDYQSRFGGL